MTETRGNGILARSALPATAVFEMTYACNHQCLYCSCPWEVSDQSYSTPPEMEVQEWQELIDYLTTEHGVSSLAFTGGEPTLKRGLAEILRYAATRKSEYILDDPEKGLHKVYKAPEIYLITNGRNLNEEWVNLLLEVGVKAISISLPGLSTYALHTRQGKAQDALDWMKKCSDAGLHVTANVTATQLNLHELFETIGQAFLHGAKFLLMNRFLPGGRGLGYVEKLSLTGRQVREALTIADRVLTLANRPGSLGTEVPKCLVHDLEMRHLTVGTRCAAGRDFFAIDPSGRVRPCNHSPVQMGHWREIPRIMAEDYWKEFVFKKFLPEMCGACDLADNCDGGCREAAHIVGGVLNAPDPVLTQGLDWRKTKGV